MFLNIHIRKYFNFKFSFLKKLCVRKLYEELSGHEEATTGGVIKKVFLKISQNSQENTCTRVSFLIKLQVLARNFIKKETLAQVFSFEFCEIFKSTFYRTPSGNCFWP